MKKKPKMTIRCSECSEKITMTAEDANVRWVFNGGCPGYSVTVICPHCNQKSSIPKTPKARKLLAHKINSVDIPNGY